VEIRRLRAGEGEQLRVLRLRALRDAPDAFAESLETAQAEGAAYWDALADASEAASERVTMIAVEDERWLGMGAAFLEPDARSTGARIDPRGERREPRRATARTASSPPAAAGRGGTSRDRHGRR